MILVGDLGYTCSKLHASVSYCLRFFFDLYMYMMKSPAQYQWYLIHSLPSFISHARNTRQETYMYDPVAYSF